MRRLVLAWMVLLLSALVSIAMGEDLRVMTFSIRYANFKDGQLGRVGSWVGLRERKTDGTASGWCSTRWDRGGRKAGEGAAKLMRRKVEEIAGDKPVVMRGDFNSPADSPRYAGLLGDRFNH